MHIEAAVEAFLLNFAARGADERREPLIVVQNGEGGITGEFADPVRRIAENGLQLLVLLFGHFYEPSQILFVMHAFFIVIHGVARSRQ